MKADWDAARQLRALARARRGAVTDRLDDVAGRRRDLAPKLRRVVRDVLGVIAPHEVIAVLGEFVEQLVREEQSALAVA